jgi:hypothetical protein
MSSADKASPTPEGIAISILKDITAVSLITASSACSVIFKCSSSKRDFCMKVSFVVRPEEATEITFVKYTPTTPKQTTTITEAEQTRERQHQMCSKLQSYNRLNFIPDATGSCTLTPDEFHERLMVVSPDRRLSLDANAQHHINLIFTAAKKSNVTIHILFMELLEEVRGYDGRIGIGRDIQHTPYIVAAILAVTIVTGVASQDLHSDNVQISVRDGTINVLKLIDWDRSIYIYDEADRDRDKIVDWIRSLMDKNPPLFVLVCRFFLEKTNPALSWPENKDKIQTLIENFNRYYSDLSRRISNIKSSWHLIEEDQRRYDIFDLLTFIGFMDCLSKAARYTFINLMQFSPFIYNLFNTDDVKILEYEMISLADLLIFRQRYLESLKPAAVSSKSNPKVERVKLRLDAIIEFLNRFLVQRRPSGSGGRPRYIKRTHRKTIKKQHRNKNNKKSIRRIYRRSKIRKRNTRN